MLAATMSATDTCWNTASAIVSVDIFKKMFKPKATDKEIMKIGRIAIIVFFIVAIAGSIGITYYEVRLDIIGITVGILASVAVSVPIALGLVVRRISRWAGVGAVVIGTLAAITCSNLEDFGALHIFGFMKFSFGNTIFFVIGITLVVFLLSIPMGRLGKNLIATIISSVFVTVGLWVFFLFMNTNPALSWDTVLGNTLVAKEAGSPILFFIAMTISAVAFGVLFYVFCRLFASDLDKPEPEVDKFFKLLKTPIDVKKEVGDESQTVTAYFFVGIIVLILAAMTLLLLLFPAGHDKPAVNLILAGILTVMGLGIMWGGRGAKRRLLNNE
ncbi:MAG: hypothetical protein K8S87_03660, partial [Planctomycetes bacterium]|nr:hypothetical protein [Planctomycetota bacterium]